MNLREWLGYTLGKNFIQQSREFIAATESPEDGTTVSVTFLNPPGLAKIGRVLNREPVVLRDNWFNKDIPNAEIRITSGY